MENQPNIEELKSKINFGIKFWLEFESKSILGSGWAELLKNIEKNKEGSLTQAAKECNYSYKYAWNILKRIEKRTGKPIVITGKGGSGGGGWVKLNDWGEFLLNIYKEYLKEITKIEKRLAETMKIG
ncbi:MAG: LysR family transcriptional regulator [Candidatus Lokiarchaeota archaeon]|nr:LysR family transcriptional regulator [Candidatus Lokiarchaeota archaeon]